MYLSVRHEYGTFIFDFWGHAEGGKLTLGSGLLSARRVSRRTTILIRARDWKTFSMSAGFI